MNHNIIKMGILGLIGLAACCVQAGVPKVKMAQVGAAKYSSPEKMLSLVNQIRAKPRMCGKKLMPAVAPLKWNDTLAYSARLHATDMAKNGFYRHKNQSGMEPFDRHKRDGYTGWGGVENITAGDEDLNDALNHLLESPDHCETLMNQYITEMGMAQVFDSQSQYGNYWVQNFGIDAQRFYEIKGFPVERAKRIPFSRMFK